MYPEIQKKILYLNRNTNQLFYIDNNELLEIDNTLIDYIQTFSGMFKIITNSNYPISKIKINTKEDINILFSEKKTEINYYGFQPKLITQKDLSNYSQIELSMLGEGYSYFNTESNLLFFLKRNQDGLYYWSNGERLVGLPGPKGQKGESGRPGEPGDKGEPGAQGPALSVDFVFPRPIDDLIISQIALSKIGDNKFIFCSHDGKIYTTFKENGNIKLSRGYSFIGKEGPRGMKGEKGEKGDKGEDGQNAQVLTINEFINFDPKNKSSFEISQLDIGYTFMNVETGLIHIVSSSNGYKYVSNGLTLSGPRGAKGDRGDRGPIGERGESGVMGLPGPPGLIGPQGKQGDVGPAFNPDKIGSKLPSNFSYTEIKSLGEGYSYFCTENGLLYFIEKDKEILRFSQGFQIKGPKGDPGVGEKGEIGPRGFPGPLGPIGLKGETGPKGEKGERGDKGDRGLMGVQGPAFNPDFKISKDPSQFNLEELENYGEGCSILNTLDGNLYFIQKINDKLSVSNGYPIVGVQGERGIQGEKGEQGPRGMIGQPGRPGDNYFVYNDNRNLSYGKGGLAVGKETQILENESLRIGNREGKTTSIVYENNGGYLIENKFQFSETYFSQLCELKDGITYSFQSNNKINFNFLDKLFICNEGDILINSPVRIDKIISDKFNIDSSNVHINNWIIEKDDIQSNSVKINTKNGLQLFSNEKELFVHKSNKLEINEDVIVNQIKVNSISFNELTLKSSTTDLAFFEDQTVKFNCNNFKINNLQISGDDEMRIDGNLVINNVLRITDKLKYNGPLFEITNAIIDKLNIGKSEINIDKILLNNNLSSIETDNFILSSSNCNISFPMFQLDDKNLSLKNIVVRFDNTHITILNNLSRMNIKNDMIETNFNFRVSGNMSFTNNNYFSNSFISLEKSQFNAENSIINISKSDVKINGNIEINNIELMNNAVNFRDYKVSLHNSNILFDISEKNYFQIVNDNLNLNGMNFNSNESIFNIEKSNFKINSSHLLINEKSEIKIGERIHISNDTVKMNNVFTTFENSKIMIGDCRVIVSDQNMEFNGYELFLKDSKIYSKNKNSEFLIENDEFILKNFRVQMQGEVRINNGIYSKNGLFAIVDNEVVLENSILKIGQNKFSKDFLSINQSKFNVDNSDWNMNNINAKFNKVELDYTGGLIEMKNTKLNHYSEGILRIGLDGNKMILSNMIISGKDVKIKLNDNFAIIENKLVNSNFDWLLKDVRIDYQEGKLLLNPNFIKMKGNKLVLEESSIVYKDGNATLLFEKNNFYSSNVIYKLKDNTLEWLDKNGNQIISINQNNIDLNKLNCRIRSSNIFSEKSEIKLSNCEIGINGGNILLDDYRILDVAKTFIIKQNNWELNNITYNINKCNYKYVGNNVERLFGQEKIKNYEFEYSRCKFNWNDDKNRTLLFLGDKSAQFTFPVIDFLNSDIHIKNGNGICSYTEHGCKIENVNTFYINSKIYFEKNGFPILSITGDEILIKNAPLKIQDSYFNYIYEKKNAQLLLKNDSFYSNYIDYEIKNGQLNWNQKILLAGNQIRINDLNIDILNSPIILRNNKSKIEILNDNIEFEDFCLRMKYLKNDFIVIEKNVLKLEGNLFLKNSRFYNECLTLEPNCLKIVQAQQKFKQNDIFYEECNIELDSTSYIKIGNWEIKTNSSELNINSQKTSITFDKKIEMKTDLQKIGIGGLDKMGNDILIENERTRIIEKDGDLYVKLGKNINNNLGESVILVGEDRYVNQMNLIISLMERIEKLESLL